MEDARNYILTGPMDMYSRLGFGLYLTELKEEGIPIGICGLIKRDSLEDVDIGFAFLSRFQSKRAYIIHEDYNLGNLRVSYRLTMAGWKNLLVQIIAVN